MCHSLLRISYKGEKGQPETIACDSEEHMAAKIAEVKARSEVQRIAVFSCAYHIERVEDWKSTPYVAAAKALPL